MTSLKASERGLAIVNQARLRKGWTKTRTPLWWQSAHTSQATLRRFWQGAAVQSETFIAICEVVGIKDWRIVSDSAESTDFERSPQILLQDWGEAPDIAGFYGRTQELGELEHWIERDRCKLITVLGMGGIGKTALTVTLADRIQNQFECVIWRSLRSSPSVSSLLNQLIQFLSQGKQTADLEDLQHSFSQLTLLLRQNRCLVILDEMEGIFRSSSGRFRPYIGQYREGYEGYGELLRRIESDRHQSCIILTSREKPEEIAAFEGKTLPVRSFQLKGLQTEDAKELFKAKGVSGAEEGLTELILLYGGSPLALKVITTLIQEVFRGSIIQFLSQNTLVVGDRLRMLLKQQCDRLSNLEKELVYWLAIERHPIALSRLQANMLSPPTQSVLLEALASLERRCMLEHATQTDEQESATDESLFTLSLLVMKCVTDEFVEQAIDELYTAIETQDIKHLKLLKHYSLIPPQSCEDGDNTSTHMLKRLRNSLQPMFEGEELKHQLRMMLQPLKDQILTGVGYANANLAQLLSVLEADSNT
ncbi:NACHT domain-containing protein [Leptolyngbya sp. FACHB-541]|uniref:NB-ARC domain-containing protein n=1 Tax=Leptolyngbya sp. FACHB-541 TaxID=2692810 RepID=UPI001689BB1E|nr:NB-ARC domain-containing protein [Leptolyngbya sp. FACHB-541]MBD1999978.1 NACHT domain-containing protein [Leptolyngbya sp. FACHB-541]